MNIKPAEKAKRTGLVILTILLIAVGMVFSDPETAKGKEPMKKVESPFSYKKNAAFTDSLNHKNEYEKVGEYEFAAKISKHKEVASFDNYRPYRLWAVYIVKHGIKIREKKTYVSRRHTCQVSTYDKIE